MATWLEEEHLAQQQRAAAQQGKPHIAVLVQYYPAREGDRPYKIETVDDHAITPRQRWYATHTACFEAVERANPGTVAHEV